jgi:uncharacterized OB-fold protein
MTARPVHAGLFVSDPPGLLGTRCVACGRHTFPRASTCPYCGAETVTDVTLSDHGVLWGWTTVTASPPGYAGDVPFGFGIVDLPEGVRVVTRLTLPDERFVEGLPVTMRVVPLHVTDEGEQVETWEFGP